MVRHKGIALRRPRDGCNWRPFSTQTDDAAGVEIMGGSASAADGVLCRADPDPGVDHDIHRVGHRADAGEAPDARAGPQSPKKSRANKYPPPLASNPPPRATSMNTSAPASPGLRREPIKWLSVDEPEYRVRHIPTNNVPELMRIYRSASEKGRCARMAWAAKEYEGAPRDRAARCIRGSR